MRMLENDAQSCRSLATGPWSLWSLIGSANNNKCYNALSTVPDALVVLLLCCCAAAAFSGVKFWEATEIKAEWSWTVEAFETICIDTRKRRTEERSVRHFSIVDAMPFLFVSLIFNILIIKIF